MTDDILVPTVVPIEYTKTLKLPRVYFGMDWNTKKWELWLVGFNDPMNGTTFKDLEWDEVMDILNKMQEKYPLYTTSKSKE